MHTLRIETEIVRKEYVKYSKSFIDRKEERPISVLIKNEIFEPSVSVNDFSLMITNEDRHPLDMQSIEI